MSTAELVVASSGDPLARIAHARQELEDSRSLADVEAIREIAVLAREFARARKLGEDAVLYATEIINRATRRQGELLRDTPKKPGPGRGKTSTHGEHVSSPRQQVGKKSSAQSQQIATLPSEVFEKHVAEPTTRLVKLAKRRAAANKPAPPDLHVVRDSCPAAYPAIVIDPPWQYDNKATRGAAEDHYPTMSLDQLEALDVPAADNAHLYLWVTNGFLRQGFDLLDVWGFAYKTCLTWVKPQIGMGNYFRNNTEHVLFAIRGTLATRRNDVPTWFRADRTKHSAKPECFYDLVEACSPGPYMEMFARRRRTGWNTWGNEA